MIQNAFESDQEILVNRVFLKKAFSNETDKSALQDTRSHIINFLHFSLDFLPRIRVKVTLRKLNPTAFNEVLMSLLLKTDAH